MKRNFYLFLVLWAFLFLTNCKKEEEQYRLTLATNLENAGVVIGSGDYDAGTEVSITATSNSGYIFKNWTHDTIIVSTNANFTYTTPSKDITLTANFLKKHTLTLQPNAADGIDAFLYNIGPNTNYETHFDFAAIATTNSGTPAYARGLIKFDFSVLPSDAIIDSVTLTLYGYNSPANGTHRTISGSNACLFKRITENWDESTVTWNNQPNTTDQDAVSIPMSTSDTQSYTINITQAARYMIKNPSNNFGFKIQLVTESYYRQLVFASSDNSNSSIHPKIVIYYASLE